MGFYPIILLHVCLILGTVSDSQSQTIQEAKRVICQFNSWSLNRRGYARFQIANIDANLCTHAIYAYVGIPRNRSESATSNEAIFFNVNNGAYTNFTSLKRSNPALKTLASVGGWVQTPQTLSRMSATKESRSDFIQSAILFLKRYDFDGINLDWEYPERRDKSNFVHLLKDMKEEFSNHSFIVSVSVSGDADISGKAYDVANISKNVDFIIVKAYDYPRSNRQDCSWSNAPLRAGISNAGLEICDGRQNVESSVGYWLNHGAPARKLVLGVAAFGRFMFKEQSSTGRNFAFRFPMQSFNLAYRDICQYVSSESWNTSFEEIQRIPLTESEFYRVSYDDERSITEKCDYIKEKSLGGALLDSLDSDAFAGQCSTRNYPLLKTIWLSLNEAEIDNNLRMDLFISNGII